MIEITTLGTGSPLPDPNRAGAANLVRAGGLTLLFDAGRGVCLRLAAAGTGPAQLTAVLLTHLHSDHICDLNDVVTTRWVGSLVPNPLPLIGPPGTVAMAAGMQAMLAADISYRIAHHDDLTEAQQLDIVEARPGVVLDQSNVRVIAASTDHRPVEPTLGYRVEHDGSAVVIGGDGVPCAGLDELCAGADVYVQTVLREDLIRAIGVPRLLDTIDYHSTVQQAAETATRGGVHTLVLTHMVPGVGAGTEDEWVAMAAAHFDGEIVLANDLTVVTA